MMIPGNVIEHLLCAKTKTACFKTERTRNRTILKYNEREEQNKDNSGMMNHTLIYYPKI